MNKNDLIQNSKRIVIKIGSALLIDKENGNLNNKWLNSLALDINNLLKLEKEVIIVSSGSIALGKKQLKLRDNLSLDEAQNTLFSVIGKFYKTSINIHKSAEPKINRSLDQSNFFQMTNYKAPPWEEMICDMYNWGKK